MADGSSYQLPTVVGLLVMLFITGCASRSVGLLSAKVLGNEAGTDTGKIVEVTSWLDLRTVERDAGASLGPRRALYFCEVDPASTETGWEVGRTYHFRTPPMMGSLVKKVIRHQGLDVGLGRSGAELDLGVATSSVTWADLGISRAVEIGYQADDPAASYIRILPELSPKPTQHVHIQHNPKPPPEEAGQLAAALGDGGPCRPLR